MGMTDVTENDTNTTLNDNQIIHHLSGETTRLISSSQIISSVSAVVKECFENSLDAGAQNIQVKLENFGLNLIKVKDDGYGISYENVQKMFLPGFTSKINSYCDLDKLTTYGFRGEALAAICQLGETCVTTKRAEDALAMTYEVNKLGEPSMSFPSHLPKGTTIAVKNLFSNLPVRKQYASSKKKMVDELKKVEHVVQSLSVIHPQLRVVITHNKSNIWQKNSVKSLKQSFMQVVGLRHASKMEILNKTDENVEIQLVIPKKDALEIATLFSTNSCNSFVFVNCRPIISKEITKAVDEIVGEYWQITDKHVLFLVSLTLPSCDVDVNLEPNKTKVLINNLPEILLSLEDLMRNYYGSMAPMAKHADPFETPCKKIRLDSSGLCNETKSDISYQEETNAICSQINKENCILASEKEKSDLNDKFIKNGHKIVATSLTHLSRDDIQEKVSSSVSSLNHQSDPLFSNEKKNPIPYEFFIETASQPVYKVNNGMHINEEGMILTEGDINEANVSVNNADKIQILESHFGINQSKNNSTVSYEVSTVLDPSSLELSKNELLNKSNDSSYYVENNISPAKQDMTKDSWSRGQFVLPNGRNLEGGAALLTSNKLINSKNLNCNKNENQNENWKMLKLSESSCTNEIGEEVSKFNLSLQSVSSQMGKKELSGFTKFARIMRPKIIEENPNIMFTEVSKQLVERWQLLSSDEKEYYETVAKAVDEERKVHRQQKIVTVPTKPVKQVQALPLKIPKRPDRQKTQVTLELETVVNLRKQFKTCPNGSNSLHRLIGQLPEQGNWLFMKNQEIGGIRHQGLNELILFNKMIANFTIVTRKLDRPEYLNNLNLGEQNWNCLLSLETEFDIEINRHIITSPVIVKNGFRIEIVKSDLKATSTAFLTEVAIELEDYGITELREALELYQENGDFSTIDKMRPSVVRQYIETEVKRIMNGNIMVPNREEITTQLCTWQESLQHLSAKCLHGRDIFLSIHTILNSAI